MSTFEKTARLDAFVSLVALAVSLFLPWKMGPGISWEEASFGYIPAGIAFVVFRLLAQIAASKRLAADETFVPPDPATTRRAFLNFLAAAAVIGGGVGAGFSAVSAYESWQIADSSEHRREGARQELDKLKGQPDVDQKKVEELESEIRSTSSEHFRGEGRLYAYCAAGCGVLVLAGVAWLVHAFRTRVRPAVS